MCFWATVFMLIYGVGLLAGAMWPTVAAYADTYLLLSLGAACFVNFFRNRTLHCSITAPVFIAGALGMGLIEAGVWRINPDVVWGGVLIAVAAALMFELRVTSSSDSACAP